MIQFITDIFIWQNVHTNLMHWIRYGLSIVHVIDHGIPNLGTLQLKLAAQPYPWMTVSRLELDSAERSYTYRTMEKLSEQFPMHRFFFIMGGDSLDYFEQWKQPERIAKLATILVIPRDLFTIAALEKKIRLLQEQFPCDIRIVPCERFLMSSTKIRQALMRGEHPEHAFPEEVSAYIRRHHLYQS